MPGSKSYPFGCLLEMQSITTRNRFTDEKTTLVSVIKINADTEKALTALNTSLLLYIMFFFLFYGVAVTLVFLRLTSNPILYVLFLPLIGLLAFAIILSIQVGPIATLLGKNTAGVQISTLLLHPFGTMIISSKLLKECAAIKKSAQASEKF